MILKKETNILIVGLGLIGGSYAMALKKQGYKVTAITKKQQDVDYAIENGIIDNGFITPEKAIIQSADLIIFALYPHVFTEFIKNCGKYIKSGTIVTDVTGVKSSIIDEIWKNLPQGVEFIAAHPMAGREVYGVKNSTDKIFIGANYIVVPTEKNTEKGIEICKSLGETIGFLNISVLSPSEHDEMIAFLSQLTHCIAVSLMCTSDNENLVRYTGDSFRDLTRIAKINEDMWSELFMLNTEPLLSQMDAFLKAFTKLRNSLEKGDTDTMKNMMRLSTSRRKLFDKQGETKL